ncbi:hypothetical protein GCM10007989_31560 [Devosia pacifica]|uniref:Uncharacterized protein n=1 Tax=Devosia pacifica TaxID=1335967 RepID=A0A918VX21_9HYPH|nr:glycoside hydrolase family 127 protein [Devosia pacifica]GHA33115.1 hypothetical protein GCM10007989_31560 [Devosia pacifica]
MNSSFDADGVENGHVNRSPLTPTPLIPIGMGRVRATGWLEGQLRRQAEGLTGHAEAVLPEIGPDNGWRGGDGENWEKGPYYLRGLVSLAFVLDDPELKARARQWIDAILVAQREDGQIGPDSNPDWWPRMVICWTMRDYFEASGDPRIIPALMRYARYLAANIEAHPCSNGHAPGWRTR